MLWNQILSIVAVMAYSFVATLIIAKILKSAMGLRTTEDDETVARCDKTIVAEPAPSGGVVYRLAAMPDDVEPETDSYYGDMLGDVFGTDHVGEVGHAGF